MVPCWSLRPSTSCFHGYAISSQTVSTTAPICVKLSPNSATGRSRLSNAPLTRSDFNCSPGDGWSNEPSLGSIETAVWPKISRLRSPAPKPGFTSPPCSCSLGDCPACSTTYKIKIRTLSAAAHDQVQGKLDLAYADMGEQQVKNITRPVRAYRVVLGEPPRAVPAPALALPDKPSIAVLPFANMSGDPEQEYFADGMVEEIITALSRIRWLFVIARNSSFTYKGQAVDVKRVGRELGVRYVLEGSVRKGGGRVRITAQLIEAETGTHLWADRFDGLVEDVFELQDRVAISVAGVIEPALQ